MRFDQRISNSQNSLLLNYDGSTDEFTEELLGVSFLDFLKFFRMSLSSGRSALIYQFTDTSVAASAVGVSFVGGMDEARCVADGACVELVYSGSKRGCSKFSTCSALQRNKNQRFSISEKKTTTDGTALLSTRKEPRFLQRAVSLLQLGLRRPKFLQAPSDLKSLRHTKY